MASAPKPRFLAAGDTALVVEFGDRVDAHLSALVLALGQKLEAAKLAGVVEVVPTIRSLMVHYDPLQLSHADLQQGIVPLLPGLEAAEVAKRSGLSLSQVVERHSQASQLVYMMGFLPGLPYLGGLPPEFAL